MVVLIDAERGSASGRPWSPDARGEDQGRAVTVAADRELDVVGDLSGSRTDRNRLIQYALGNGWPPSHRSDLVNRQWVTTRRHASPASAPAPTVQAMSTAMADAGMASPVAELHPTCTTP